MIAQASGVMEWLRSALSLGRDGDGRRCFICSTWFPAADAIAVTATADVCSPACAERYQELSAW